MSRLRRHPDLATVALFSGGDLGFARRWLVKRHIATCQRCASAVASFVRDREALRAETPAPEVDFEALAHRIRVAAEQRGVANARPGLPRWKAAAAGLAATAAIVALLLHGGGEVPGPPGSSAEETAFSSQLPVLGEGEDAQVTSDGTLSVRAFHSEFGAMTITEYYIP